MGKAAGKFVIQPHGRLQEWVADEKGYFADEGLDYEFVIDGPALWSHMTTTEDAPAEVKRGAFESYEAGRACSVSAACHWTVNMAASAGHGKMWAGAYSVAPSGIYVAPESPIRSPRDLAGVEVSVGYHSGSHYSTLQGLQAFLDPGQIALRFGGILYDRLALLVDRKVAAANAFGAPAYVVEQLGFRKIVDTTFMIATLVTNDADEGDVARYFRALRRAQRDIDAAPEKYVHYFLRELPERYHGMVEVEAFGPGERLVFEPYSREVFERTHRWIEDHDLFPAEQAGSAGYAESVMAAA